MILIRCFDPLNNWASMGVVAIAAWRIVAVSEDQGHTAIVVDGLTRTLFTDEPMDVLLKRLAETES